MKAGIIKHLASCLLAANVCACAASTRQDGERASTFASRVEAPAAAPVNAPASTPTLAGLDPDSIPEPTEPAIPVPASNHATSASAEPRASSGEPTNTAPGTVACSFEFGWSSPSWLEVHSDDGGTNANLRSDSHGNLYCVGEFANSVDFGLGTLTCEGCAGGFVMKLSPSCTPLWVSQYGGPNAEVNLGSIAVDRDDNLIVVGSVSDGSVDFGAGTISTGDSGHGLTSVGVVLKLDSEGRLLWNQVVRSASGLTGIGDVGVSDAGDIVVSGGGSSDVHFDATAAPADATGDALFVARIGANGEPGAIDRITGTDRFGSVAVDASGRVAISGWAFGAMSTGAIADYEWPAGLYDHFLFMLDPGGALAWSRHLEQITNEEIDGLLGYGLEFDLAGNLVLSYGRWTYTGTGPTFHPAVVQKLDATGDELWKHESTYAGSADLWWTGRLAVDSHGNVLHVDELAQGTTLDGESYAVHGDRDLLVRKRDADGDIVWSTQLGGDGFDLNWGLGTDPSDAVWVGSEQQAPDGTSGKVTITKLVP